MGLSMIVYVLPTILVCVLLPIVLMRKSRSRKLPRGPVGMPVVGHLNLLLGGNPHQTFYKLSKIHGPFMSLRLGSRPVIVASSAETAKQILHVHDHIFAGRPPSAVNFHINSSRNLVYAQPGPYWKLIRQLCASELFSRKSFEALKPIRAQELGDLLLSISNAGESFLHVRDHLYTTSTNIISRMLLGKRLSELAIPSQAQPSHHILTLSLEWLHLTAAFNIGDFIPCLEWLDLQGLVKESKALRGKCKTVFQEVVHGRRAGSHGVARRADFLDALLSASSLDKYKHVQVTDENIGSVLLNIFAGGIDTSSLSIEWALALLLENPEKMNILQEEINNKVGVSRLVEESDIPYLPYLQAVVKETLRLYPVAPLLIPHFSSQPCNILDFEIPLNTWAFVNIWAIGRDPDTWENPLQFIPERFLNNNIDVYGQEFSLLPFGSGRRICPGLRLGLVSVQCILANIIHCFHWTPRGKIDLAEKYEIVLELASPLMVKATPRLPKNLYGRM